MSDIVKVSSDLVVEVSSGLVVEVSSGLVVEVSSGLVVQVKLLKDILEAWKAEVEKKPPTMSLEEAYTVLKLPKGANGWVEMGQWVGRDGPISV